MLWAEQCGRQEPNVGVNGDAIFCHRDFSLCQGLRREALRRPYPAESSQAFLSFTALVE